MSKQKGFVDANRGIDFGLIKFSIYLPTIYLVNVKDVTRLVYPYNY